MLQGPAAKLPAEQLVPLPGLAQGPEPALVLLQPPGRQVSHPVRPIMRLRLVSTTTVFDRPVGEILAHPALATATQTECASTRTIIAIAVVVRITHCVSAFRLCGSV